MKKVTTLALLGCAIFAQAGATGDTALIYDWSKKKSYQVVGAPIGKITRPLGFHRDIDVIAWAGASGSDLAGGFAFTTKTKLADNVDFSIGLAAGSGADKPKLLGPYIGLTWRL